MKAWGIAATLGFAILAFALGQAAGLAVLFAVEPVDLSHLADDGTALAIVTFVANPIQVVTLVLAARLTGNGAASYLALDRPRWRNVALGVATIAAVIAIGDLATYAAGKDIVPTFQLAVHRSAQADGTLVWLWLAIVVAAPVGEEIMFRGFLFRGFVREPRNALPGIVVISLMWGLLHLGQYDLFSVAVIFAIGIVLGYVRHLSGSTTLTIILHMLLNLESIGETLLALGWF
jgi:membrane protease YdiL (CAAX protease family)